MYLSGDPDGTASVCDSVREAANTGRFMEAGQPPEREKDNRVSTKLFSIICMCFSHIFTKFFSVLEMENG